MLRHAYLALIFIARLTMGEIGMQDCIACGSEDLGWKDQDHCMRFESLPQTIASSNFVGRHGHASAVFPYNERLALWVIGGRGTSYEKWNFQVTHRRADVWVYLVEEMKWEKIENMRGDFFARTDEAFLMEDVLDPGDVAPFWERFGHSLDVFSAWNVSAATGDILGQVNAMVICGGFTPRPDNDVWVSKDGISWFRIGYAPWTGRGYHATAVYRNRLFVMGGSPLTNDVWAGDFNTTGADGTGRDHWSMKWIQMGAQTGSFDAPTTWSLLDDTRRWSPRAGAGAAVQYSIPTNRSKVETLYLTGGLASWPEDHPLYDGQRGRNDVWKTEDGANWTRVVEAAPWAARAWHSLVTWTDLTDVYTDVSLAATQPDFAGEAREDPRIWLAGGGYVGRKGNSIVKFVDGYYDLWWSRDGETWTQVGSSEGAGGYLCTSLEVFKLNDDYYLGKYGHTMIPFWQVIPDAKICVEHTYNQFGFIVGCAEYDVSRVIVPTLFFIAGDPGHLDGQKLAPSGDVYVSRAPILCEIDGHKCPSPDTKIIDYGGSPASFRREIATEFDAKATKAGYCGDPMADCPDQLGTCGEETDAKVTFFIAPNATGELEYAPPRGYTKMQSVVRTDKRFAYTVYNISKYDASRRHPRSMSGIYVHDDNESYLQGFVARIPGCRCDAGFEGEYCGTVTDFDAAAARAPSRALAVILPLALLRRAF